jgi:hypothetical protein
LDVCHYELCREAGTSTAKILRAPLLLNWSFNADYNVTLTRPMPT